MKICSHFLETKQNSFDSVPGTGMNFVWSQEMCANFHCTLNRRYIGHTPQIGPRTTKKSVRPGQQNWILLCLLQEVFCNFENFNLC